MSKTNDERETPPDLVAELERRFGHAFTLDVAATPANAICTEYYSLDTVSGLDADWRGHVWCNPPYSEIDLWVAKAWASSYPTCESITMLLPANRTEQPWWQRDVEPFRELNALKTHFLRKRRKFLINGKPILDKQGNVGAPKFGLVVLRWART